MHPERSRPSTDVRLRRGASALAFCLTALLALTAIRVQSQRENVAGGGPSEPLQVSGIYPHLAVFNDTGSEHDGECGIGAIVPWAGRLWVITYPPHRRTGSADKLYEIDAQLQMTIRPESVGGTHAGRMIHRESQQLIIGPYFIDANGKVRAVNQTNGFPARITAVARHLTDPANRVYMFDMEGPIWEVDVHTLEPRRLFVKPAPGWHGKGAYTAQGRLIIANNGEVRTTDLDGLAWEAPEATWSKGAEDAGALAEFDGRRWTLISRRPHTEVTGPGGLLGESAGDAPVWSLGWDKRSVLLHVRSSGTWLTYRLPKGSYTYDPAHGWFTEWPRIRDIGGGPLLLNMHGTFFDFPSDFAPGKTSGVRPLSTHLHYTTDFAEWNGRVVLAGDDTSIMENPLAAKPQSNLRFVRRTELSDKFGPRSGWGGMWVNDQVKAGQPSDPFLIAGYTQRDLHLAHNAGTEVTFSLEVDAHGDGRWQEWRVIRVPAHGYLSVLLPDDTPGEWLRVKVNRDCVATAFLHAHTPHIPTADDARQFASLASRDTSTAWIGGLLRPAGFSRDLQFLARPSDANGRAGAEVYYEVNERLQFTRVDAPGKIAELKRAAEPSVDYAVDKASVVVTDAYGRRWRLPKATDASHPAGLRGMREVVSERYLANFDGTFYEIPRLGATEAPDFRRMKPIATHRGRISDFASWRGLLVLAGTRPDATPDGHFFRAGDSGAGLWFGAVDDLYKLGAPSGSGGPWKDTRVNAGEPSDPYLMTNFGRKSLTLAHDRDRPVRFTIEIDFLADGSWHQYKTIDVAAGQTVTYRFPEGFSAHWVRVMSDRAGEVTAWFRYDPDQPLASSTALNRPSNGVGNAHVDEPTPDSPGSERLP